MVDNKNVTVVGCSVHFLMEGVVLYSLWVTDNDTLSTSMILMEKDMFNQLTHTKMTPKRELTLRCNYCNNHKCLLREKSDLQGCLNKIFTPHRKYERVNVDLRGFVNKDGQIADIKITDISLGGMRCEIVDDNIEVIPGETVKISICNCNFLTDNFLTDSKCKKCFNLKELSGETIEGRVIWLIGKNCGIQVESSNSMTTISGIMGFLGIG